MRTRLIPLAAAALSCAAALAVLPRDAQAANVPGEIADGIQKLTGHVTFNPGNVSIDVSIPANGGSFSGGTNFLATGGDETVGTLPWTSAVVDFVTESVSADDLSEGTEGEPYYAGVSYDLDGKTYVFTGSIPSAPSSGSSNIKLYP